MVREVGVSPSTVLWVWRDHKIQPFRSRTLMFSQDPHLVAKVNAVVGLYLHRPEKAVVLCVDEKSQIQALDRTQPLLPRRPDQVERPTHDYVRHGTATLFAALDVATGEVTGCSHARHRHQEFLAFPRLVIRRYPPGPLHPVFDRTPKHPEVQEWLRKHPRIHLHFTPTSASWINRLATWFSIIHRKANRRGVFHSVPHLKDAIQRFIDASSAGNAPSSGSRPPDQILVRANHQGICAVLH